MTLVNSISTPFQQGPRLIDGTDLNNALAYPLTSAADGITAHAGGLQTNAFQLTAVKNNVTTVANAGDSVKLPLSSAGAEVTVINNGANSLQVYGTSPDTINGIATGTGVAVAAGATATFRCTIAGAWNSPVGANNTFGAVTASSLTLTSGGTVTFKSGSNIKAGTFVANGATPVTVGNTSVDTHSMILISLNTVGGTVGAIPAVQTITAGTGFTVAGTASDTSTYNYVILETN